MRIAAAPGSVAICQGGNACRGAEAVDIDAVADEVDPTAWDEPRKVFPSCSATPSIDVSIPPT
jgi:hypothetical protein